MPTCDAVFSLMNRRSSRRSSSTILRSRSSCLHAYQYMYQLQVQLEYAYAYHTTIGVHYYAQDSRVSFNLGLIYMIFVFE